MTDTVTSLILSIGIRHLGKSCIWTRDFWLYIAGTNGLMNSSSQARNMHNKTG